VIITTSIGTNAIVANIQTFRTYIQYRKNDAREYSRIGANTARIFA